MVAGTSTHLLVTPNVSVLLDTIRQNFVDHSEYFAYNQIRTVVRLSFVVKGDKIKMLNENNMELLRIIRENDNPVQALMTATLIVLGYLKQHESSEEQVAVDLRVLC